MKMFLIFASIGTITTVSAAIPTTQATLRIIDAQSQCPMSNVIVTASFMTKDHWDKRDEYEKIKVLSDSLGEVVLSGNDIDNYFYAKINYTNFYESIIKVESRDLNRVLNRWEPWNPMIRVNMRAIKNPVSMVYQSYSMKKVPAMNKPIGFDLEVGDWVIPHGKGRVSDLLFNASWFFQDSLKGSEGRHKLTFANQTDGIQIFQVQKNLSSSFKWPYEASLDGYQPSLEKSTFWPVNGGKLITNCDDRNNYIFRVRSKQLEDGTIIGCYGMIQKEVQVGPRGGLKLEYWFNPTPNQRSLEWNGVNLLQQK